MKAACCHDSDPSDRVLCQAWERAGSGGMPFHSKKEHVDQVLLPGFSFGKASSKCDRPKSADWWYLLQTTPVHSRVCERCCKWTKRCVLQQKYCNAKSICFQIVFYHWSHVVNLLLPWCTWGKLRQGPHVLYQGIRSSSYVLVSAVWEHHSKLSGSSLWPRVLKYTWTYGTSISYY